MILHCENAEINMAIGIFFNWYFMWIKIYEIHYVGTYELKWALKNSRPVNKETVWTTSFACVHGITVISTYDKELTLKLINCICHLINGEWFCWQVRRGSSSLRGRCRRSQWRRSAHELAAAVCTCTRRARGTERACTFILAVSWGRGAAGDTASAPASRPGRVESTLRHRQRVSGAKTRPPGARPRTRRPRAGAGQGRWPWRTKKH